MAVEKINEEVESNVAESTKKKKKEKSLQKKGAISILLMVGGALGVVIMIIASVIIGTVLANKLFPPQTGMIVVTDDEDTDKKHLKKLKPFPTDDEDFEDTISLLQDDEWLTFDDCKSQTNVRGSTTICVIDIAVTYKPYYVEELKAKGFLTKPGKDSHGNPTLAGVNKNHDLFIKLKRNVKTSLLDFISKHTASELQGMQSSGTLSDSLKMYLKNSFKDIGLVIGKVDVTYFIIS